MDQPSRQKALVSAVIPAFNEGETIGRVIRTILTHTNVGEVIVIDDGSKDHTAEVARQAGARVAVFEDNQGKAVAMDEGVALSQYPYIFFSDADLLGLTHEMISELIDPVLLGNCDLCIGIRNRKFYRLQIILRCLPLIGGERVLTREVWRVIPDKQKKKFQIELAMNYHTKATGRTIESVLLPGLKQVVKEKKHGFIEGFVRRLGMGWDLLNVSIRLYIFESFRLWLRKRIREKEIS